MDADRHGLARPQRLTCKAIFATENDRMENGLHDPQDRANLSPLDARKLFRSGAFTGPTSGISMGHVQANIVILPYEPASQFVRFCVRNSRCCPLIGVSEAGGIGLDALGADIDMRSDLPKYRIYRHGKLDREAQDISQYWRDDFVIFAIGCSFSFEEGMLSAGLPVRHIETGSIVPMYRTNLPTEPAGAFGGPYVVSMRPLPPADVERAVEVTSRFPYAHGAPVHWGNPSEIGITDLACPDFGDPPQMTSGEVPVFWACGVTPQVAVEQAKPEIAITHAPGSMLITDLPSDSPPALISDKEITLRPLPA
jgi:uncharacterized protein YcsI (UPF0317 family)